jgi:ABC-type branched-subunit amino acid transport system substrate-binding protein
MQVGRTTKLAVFTAALALLAGCQSTTSDATDSSGDTYPDSTGSPGIEDSVIRLGLPASISDRGSDSWSIYGPVYAALEQQIDKINSDGGVLGYELEQVPLADGYSGEEQSTEEYARSLCAYGVIEHPTLVTGAPYDSISLLRQAGCVGSKRVINILPTRLISADELESSPDVVAPYALDDVTAAHTLVERLTALDFFEGANKVAIFSPGPTYADTARQVLAPEIEALGIADPLVITTDDSTKAAANSIALQMKSAGIERVVWFGDTSSGLDVLAAMVAQDFTPPLGGLNSVVSNLTIEFYGYPAEQLYVVSTLANYQSGQGGDSEFTSVPDTPASEQCEEYLRATGLKLAAQTNFSLFRSCDVPALTVEALEASGAEDPSVQAFFDGLTQLDVFGSAFGVELDFSDGRAGVSQVWDLRGDEACACLEVAGGPHPISRR